MRSIGRPTTYQPDYALQAKEWCAQFPFTHDELAKVFKVSRATIHNWKKEHPEFLASISDGVDDYHNPNVEKSLVRKAIGYDYTETMEEMDGNGALVKIRKTHKHAPPDTGALSFYLRNRKPDRWKDKVEIEAHHDIQIVWQDDTAIDVTPEPKKIEGVQDGG